MRGKFLRKQVWKQKWRKKFGGGADVCFRCGGKGHWASECRGKDLGSFPEEIPQEKPLLTLDEAAQRTNGDFTPEIPDGSSTENSQLPLDSLDFPKPEFSPPSPPPPPLDPLYPPNPDGTIPDPPEEVLEALRTLGFDSFRPGQAEAIMRVLCGISTLLLLPTGSGKSLCYQLPAFLYHRRSRCISIVISPLISLMDDQVSGLPSALTAVCIHSNLTPSQREAAIEKVRSGQAQILLLSPESVTGSGFFSRLFRHFPPVAFACLDEAHCISHWSHNFRPAYLRVCKVLRERLGVRCFLGLTATATVATARDVAKHLGIAEGNPTIGAFGIPENLRLSVSLEDDPDQAVLRVLRERSSGNFGNCGNFGNSVLVLCARREDSERLARLIRSEFPEVPGRKTHKGKREAAQVCAAYHAGLSARERRRVLGAFTAGTVWALCGTACIGLGMDAAPLRGVLQHGGPGCAEAFLQHVGRAGRDGKAAWGHLCLHKGGVGAPLRAFTAGTVWALCGTACIGLGMDAAPLRGVLQHGGPGCAEAFLQHVGRAGRDGKAAWGHLCLHRGGVGAVWHCLHQSGHGQSPPEGVHGGPGVGAPLRAFTAGTVWALCGTACIGLGMDTAPLRGVLQHGGPGCAEAFLQHVGRAGRDGKAAWGHLCLHRGGVGAPLRAFTAGTVWALCGTACIGLGMDAAPLRGVLQHGGPGCAEAFLQHVGRAGRDGKAAWGHLCLHKGVSRGDVWGENWGK
ncbi:ATP-dependent DNA helicase Q4-like [Ammospiza nelsoni]|uniref:ATP-dependent DNA helicase Q4-like n=1 Tax=Ammospiza nelsoni TaxID=2857394 RepID=UPI002869EAEB|nr:ATP-dependent DNA helicase Q4-like [Ammospiza nelsoni]